MRNGFTLFVLIMVVAISVWVSCNSTETQSDKDLAERDSVSQGDSWWKPTAKQPLTLQWELAKPLNSNNAVLMGKRNLNGEVLPAPYIYDIDGANNSASTVKYLHEKGEKVICYIDVGTYETYRSDSAKFKAISPRIWGKPLADWHDEYWLNIRRIDALKPIIKARMKMCKTKGFDAIEPDNIDGFANDTGFSLTYNEQLKYNKALTKWAHEMGMSIGQKGDIGQTRDLVDSFDWTLNEQCFQYQECGPLQLYVKQNKAVWIAEYKAYSTNKWDSICNTSRENHFNTSRYKLSLDAGRMPCPTQSTTKW